MPTLAEWKLIGITLFITFFISALLYGIIGEIITRLKNKKQKSRRQQVKHMKIDLRKIVANYDEFINENTKNMFVFEKKEFIKNVNSELYSMILKGVR